MTNSVADEVSGRPKAPSISFPGAKRRSLVGGLAAASWAGAALFTAMWPDKPEQEWAYTNELAVVLAAVATIIAMAVVVESRYTGLRRLHAMSPWLVALALFAAAWEAVTAKFALLPLPFFPP